MYEPVLRIPLIVQAPGQVERRDVYTPMSNVDLVPTILSLAGREIPDSMEGRILPGLGGTGEADRSVFSVYARDNSSFVPLEKFILTMRKGDHKLIYYRDYPGYEDRTELYHLGEDPEELHDLVAEDSATARLMKEELLDHFIAATHQRNR